jgi:ATP-binding cassette subfamily B protein
MVRINILVKNLLIIVIFCYNNSMTKFSKNERTSLFVFFKRFTFKRKLKFFCLQLFCCLDTLIYRYFSNITQGILLLALKKHDIRALYRAVTLFTSVWILNILITYISNLIKSTILPNIERDIRADMFDYVQYFTQKFFIFTKIGSIENRISEMADGMKDLIENFSVDIVPILLSLFVISTDLIYRNLLCGLITILWGTSHLVISYVLSKKISELSKKQYICQNELSSFMVDSFKNQFIKTIFNFKKNEFSNFVKLLEIERGVNNELSRLSTRLKFILAANCVIFQAIILPCLLVYNLSKGTLDKRSCTMIFTINSGLISCFWDIADLLTKIFKSHGQCAQSLSLLSENESDEEKEGDIMEFPENGDIVFTEVSIYHGNYKSLDGINLTIPSGKLVALLGQSGSGKSTMIKALAGIEEISRGKITIGGVDIRRINKEVLRSRIAYVVQGNMAFDRSILENLKVGDPDASEKKIIAALKYAQALGFVEKLRDKINTKFSVLSGGQAQRICIARALLVVLYEDDGEFRIRDGSLLMLDEPASALDPPTRTEIINVICSIIGAPKGENHYLDGTINSEGGIEISRDLNITGDLPNPPKGITTLWIDHSMLIGERADTIVLLHAGKIIAEGHYSDMINNQEYIDFLGS